MNEVVFVQDPHTFARSVQRYAVLGACGEPGSDHTGYIRIWAFARRFCGEPEAQADWIAAFTLALPPVEQPAICSADDPNNHEWREPVRRDGVLVRECAACGAEQEVEAPEPEWQPVQSSNIAAIRYHVPTRELDVRFRSGAEYRYAGVPAEVFDQFLAAESKGVFLGRAIKPRYAYTKLEAMP